MRLNLKDYDPTRQRLPDNNFTRRALAADARRGKKREARRHARLLVRIRAALAPFVGQPNTPDLRIAMLEKVRVLLGVPVDIASALLDEATATVRVRRGTGA